MIDTTRDKRQAESFISPQMAKALANPWRNQIIAECNLRPLSPSQFVAEVGGELTSVSRYFRQLAKWDYLEIVEKRSGGHRRGAVEHIYRATRRARFDTSAWDEVPDSLKSECSINLLEAYLRRISQAVSAKTLDAEVDRHLSWKALSLDRQAWTQFVTRLDEVLNWVTELEVEAAERMARTNEEPIPATVGLAGFRSPKSSEV